MSSTDQRVKWYRNHRGSGEEHFSQTKYVIGIIVISKDDTYYHYKNIV